MLLCTSWLSFVISNCEVGTFPFVSWVRCCAFIVSIPDLCSFSYFVLPIEIGKFIQLKWVNISLSMFIGFLHHNPFMPTAIFHPY